MASRTEVYKVMSYLAADLDVFVSDEKLCVWCDQFQEVSYDELIKAARIMAARKFFGKFPRVSDMWEALAELRTPEKATWAEAWDDWVTCARRYGSRDYPKAIAELEKLNPMAVRALGTMAREYFEIHTQDLPTFRAQFRQRFEALVTRDKQTMTRPPELSPGSGGNLLQLVKSTSEKLALPQGKKNGTEK